MSACKVGQRPPFCSLALHFQAGYWHVFLAVLTGLLGEIGVDGEGSCEEVSVALDHGRVAASDNDELHARFFEHRRGDP